MLTSQRIKCCDTITMQDIRPADYASIYLTAAGYVIVDPAGGRTICQMDGSDEAKLAAARAARDSKAFAVAADLDKRLALTHGEPVKFGKFRAIRVPKEQCWRVVGPASFDVQYTNDPASDRLRVIRRLFVEAKHQRDAA